MHHHEEKKAAVLLTIARVGFSDKYSTRHTVRALIDLGSEISLASEALAQRLSLLRLPASMSIYGVGGQQTGSTQSQISLKISLLTTNLSMHLSVLVLRILMCGS